MTETPCDRLRRFQTIDAAYRVGDLEALRRALGQPPDFPNVSPPWDLGLGDHLLEYALYWSPLPFIEALLAAGADPNDSDQGGFPALHAALSSQRPDQPAVLERLLQAGADPNQRGLNDWTPLHHAVARKDLRSIEVLLAHGADPALATRIDDLTTPLEDAATLGFDAAQRAMRHALAERAEPAP